MAEVIDLSDDEINVIEPEDVLKPPKRKRFKCLNAECRNEANLIKAPINIRRFYGVLSFPKKTKVCSECLNYAQVHSKSVIDSVRAGKLILSLEHKERRNTVVLTDSDSDLTDNEPASEDSEFEYDPAELYNITKESMNQNGFDDYDETDHHEKINKLIGNIAEDLRLKNQIEEGAKSIKERLTAAEAGFQSLNNEYKNIEASIDSLRNNFYDAFKQDIKWLPPIEIGPPSLQQIMSEGADVIAETSIYNPQKNLPPLGPLTRPELRMYDKVYSMKNSLYSRWVEASVMSIEKRDPTSKIFKICYVRSSEKEKILGRAITGKNLAYYHKCPTRIPVGTRIIARYIDEDQQPLEGGSFYVGIVAEIPTGANKYRYLVFFDDGYAQYVIHSDIRIVVECSQQPWEDVASDSREFIKDYLHTYPERPMVRLQKFNYIKTEWNGRWWKAQVLEVDGSLVKMYFPMDGRTEWIYRGSTRLSPLFNKKMNIQTKAEQTNKTIRRRTLPFNKSAPVVEYVNFGQGQDQEQEEPSVQMEIPIEKRAVARKSTSGRPGTPPQEVQEQIYQESRGFIRKRPIKGIPMPKFTPHQCSRTCDMNSTLNEEVVSPLMKPILRNWRRQLAVERKKTTMRNVISYVAPCGRRLRSIEEVFRFLRLVESDLEIDFYSFDLGIDPTNEWEPAKKNIYLEDVSNGIEQISISCVNSLDKIYPTELIYCNIRQPIENVNLNLDPSFLVHCNCTDDCQDKSRCECWQLTTESTKYLGLGENADIGYKFRRLQEQVATGIYECNSLCSCKNTCLNRVVQHPIKQKLQLFKTARRGWGVRTLHDIPQGGFICVYVGKVLNEAVANQEGKMTTGGDDYYAELDFIEVVESMKEGYESEVEDDDEDESSKENRNVAKIRISNVGTTDSGPENATVDDDAEFSVYSTTTVSKSAEQREPSARIQARSKRGSSNSSGNNSGRSTPNREAEEEEEDGDERLQRVRRTFEPQRVIRPPKERRSARELYGDDEKVYIMDAKVSGNIGRYFNHSCQPNIFVQNVFVDTHDVRFPWVAFFSSTRIRAGVELTWDYNYEVGSVPGKIKYCYCMTKRCRGRLL